MSMYTDLIDNLEILKLDNIKNMLPGYLDEMKDKNISFTEMLYDLTKEEIKYQTERAAKVNINISDHLLNTWFVVNMVDFFSYLLFIN